MSCSVRRTRARIQAAGTVRRADSEIQDVSRDRPGSVGLLIEHALVASIAQPDARMQ
jgi:hypothetical protein